MDPDTPPTAPSATAPGLAPVVRIGNPDSGFSVAEIRERLADVARTYPDNPAVADMAAIADAMLALHDCHEHIHDDPDPAPDLHHTGRLADVRPLHHPTRRR
ncbi:hypothetical protein [Saccharothrix sp. HUAS TT1]|uniref:hypothetical protein n=1 Tax=unclassified Saccharothrix TaxID=2593673 RepID=UPI00345BBA93